MVNQAMCSSKYWDTWPHATVEEGKAEDILRTCARERGLRQIPVPVPVEEWIESPLRVNFEVGDLSYLGSDVIGSAWCGSPLSIMVSEKIENQNGRFRFTSAHELGHIVLHRDLAMRFDDADAGMLVQDTGMEAEANRFASRLLMPWHALELEMKRIFWDFDMDPRVFLPILLTTTTRSAWVWKHRILPRITNRFDVSLSAAIYRFTSITLPQGYRLLPRPIVPQLMTNNLSMRHTLAGALGTFVT